MKLTWLGHACFLLESQGFRLLTDPYEGVPGLADLHREADAVYCSHGHFDHAYLAGVTLGPQRENPFTVEEIPSFHDDQLGALRGENTIRCFSAEGLRVAHLGDLGHSLSPAQVEQIGRCDAVLIPVGGTYTLDAAGAKAVTEQLQPRVIVPMHYRQGPVGFPELQTAEDFTALFPEALVCRYETASLELGPETEPQIALLQLAQ